VGGDLIFGSTVADLQRKAKRGGSRIRIEYISKKALDIIYLHMTYGF
jgi:hypothetical protein